MTELKVPHINSNDESAILIEWSVSDGQFVQPGDLVAVLETSKSSFELLSKEKGYLHTLGRPGTEYQYGDTIGWINEEMGGVQDDDYPDSKNEEDREIIFTKAAEIIMAESGIDYSDIVSLGKSLIRAEDIEALMGRERSDTDGTRIRLSVNQRAVARLVTEAHRTVPSAFSSITVMCKSALASLEKINVSNSRNIGLTELLIFVLARCRKNHSIAFSQYLNEGSIRKSSASNVAVTVDVGSGLFLPVIKNADEKSLLEIEDKLSALRLKVMRGKLDEESLQDATIGLSLNLNEGITMVIPIIPIPLTAILSLGGHQETVLIRDGIPHSEISVTVGISFDHRVINGSAATNLLTDIKREIQGFQQ